MDDRHSGVGVGWAGLNHRNSNTFLVSFHVKRQMIRTAKGTCAELTAEGFQSGVLPVVAGELVRSGKSPNTAFPCADVWFFT